MKKRKFGTIELTVHEVDEPQTAPTHPPADLDAPAGALARTGQWVKREDGWHAFFLVVHPDGFEDPAMGQVLADAAMAAYTAYMQKQSRQN